MTSNLTSPSTAQIKASNEATIESMEQYAKAQLAKAHKKRNVNLALWAQNQLNTLDNIKNNRVT